MEYDPSKYNNEDHKYKISPKKYQCHMETLCHRLIQLNQIRISCNCYDDDVGNASIRAQCTKQLQCKVCNAHHTNLSLLMSTTTLQGNPCNRAMVQYDVASS